MPQAAVEHDERPCGRLVRDGVAVLGRAWRPVEQMAAGHETRRAVVRGEVVDAPRRVQHLRCGRPRLGHEQLVGVEDASGATGSGNVAGDVSQQHRPVEHSPQQSERDRMFDEVDEHRRAAEHVPHPLVRAVGVQHEVVLLHPRRRSCVAATYRSLRMVPTVASSSTPVTAQIIVGAKVALAAFQVIGGGGQHIEGRVRRAHAGCSATQRPWLAAAAATIGCQRSTV